MTTQVRSRQNFFILFGEKILQLLAIAVVNIIILRSLGPQQYGLFSAATAIFAMSLPLADFGRIVIVRSISLRQASTKKLVGYSIYLSAITCLAALLALLSVGAWLMSGRVTGDLLILLSLAFVAKPLAACDSWFQARKLNYISSIIRSIVLVLVCGLRIIIALTSQSLHLLALVVVLENSLGAILIYLAYRFFSRSERMLLLPGVVPRKEILTMSLPMLLSGFAIILYMRVDQPMLLWLSNSTHVGLYSAAANLSDAIAFIPTVLSTVLLPSLIGLHARSDILFRIVMTRIFSFGIGFGFFAAVGGIVCGPFVVHLLYGEDYSETGLLVQILFCSGPFIFLGGLQSVWILVFKLQKEFLYISFIAGFVNIFANLLMLPALGSFGASLTTVVAYAIAGFFGNALFRTTRPIFFAQLRSLNPVFIMKVYRDLLRNKSFML